MQNRTESGRHRAMQVQLSRLFGEKSKLGNSSVKSKALWRRTLKSVLREIESYLDANVDTDEFHRLKLYSGLIAAHEALKQDDFWPGYVEGITRVTLTLLGDYPDHRKRKPGRKDAEFYKLNGERTIHWVQSAEQRFRTLMYSGAAGFPPLSEHPIEVLHRFRDQYGYKATHAEFLEWYRANFAKDYAMIFR